jgi:hypothetical protein
VLAYLSWHRAAPNVEPAAYEQALERFHRSLAHRRPTGFRGSAALRAAELPWLISEAEDSSAGGSGYEDWYMVDDWAAVGVLEEAAVARGHVTAHDDVASRSVDVRGAVYRLIEGHVRMAETRVAVWVTCAPGHADPSLAQLLGDGMDRGSGGLWRRCLGLGPAPEFCLLVSEPPRGVAPSRLPRGWQAVTFSREVIWTG